jgi:hypothetical protein
MIGGRRALLYVVGVLVIFILVGVCSTNNGGKKVAFNVTVTDMGQGAPPGESLHEISLSAERDGLHLL